MCWRKAKWLDISGLGRRDSTVTQTKKKRAVARFFRETFEQCLDAAFDPFQDLMKRPSNSIRTELYSCGKTAKSLKARDMC